MFRSADRLFTEELKVSGTQVVALFAIKEHPDCQLKDLAQLLQLQNSAISGLVGRMEENGLVHKTPSSTDGRASLLNLSPQGAEVIAAARPLLQSINAQLLAGFSAEETATVARFLEHARQLDFQGPAGQAAPATLP
nr:MarR family transcriptional regulator [Rugamonas sp. CCM 8940]